MDTVDQIAMHLACERWKDDIAAAIHQLVSALLKADESPASAEEHYLTAYKILGDMDNSPC